jgi:hypothetical protein
MRKTESLAGVLDRCLARAQSGAATVEDCLRDYPELADQLGPLLRTALRAGDLLAPSGPSAAYREASEARLLNRLRGSQAAERAQRGREHEQAARGHRQERAAGRRSTLRPRAWKPAYALAGLALAVALIGSSVGVASAAAGSLPGDRLYGVKRGLEEVSLALSVTDAGDATLLLGFADRRLAEAQALIEAGREDDLPAALGGYERVDRLLDRKRRPAVAPAGGGHRAAEQLLNAMLGAPRRRSTGGGRAGHSQQACRRPGTSGTGSGPGATGSLKRTPAAEAKSAPPPGGMQPNTAPRTSPVERPGRQRATVIPSRGASAAP